MASTLKYARTAERPAAKLWLQDDDGTLIDFSAGYTFSLKVGVPGSIALLIKTTGITGAVGAGVEPSGTPNVTITWSAAELDLTPGTYAWQLTATSSALDRVFSGTFVIEEVIT